MNLPLFIITIFGLCLLSNSNLPTTVQSFDLDKDLLLAHYDCKTDVDDLHSVAALGTIVLSEKYRGMNYYAVAGTYGIQDGLYVPASELFNLAFGSRWFDANKDRNLAIEKVSAIAETVIEAGGVVWIAEAGQSDFSSEIIKTLSNSDHNFDLKEVIKLVQHSDWNESTTSPEALKHVKQVADYFRIPDGNIAENGTPGFKLEGEFLIQDYSESEELIKLWSLAINLANKFNGVDNRYLNETINTGGLDFSDFSEIHHILEFTEIDNSADFFQFISEDLNIK